MDNKYISVIGCTDREILLLQSSAHIVTVYDSGLTRDGVDFTSREIYYMITGAVNGSSALIVGSEPFPKEILGILLNECWHNRIPIYLVREEDHSSFVRDFASKGFRFVEDLIKHLENIPYFK